MDAVSSNIRYVVVTYNNVGFTFGSPNITVHNHNISNVGLHLVQQMYIVRLELCGVVAKRLAQFLEEETRFNIKGRYFFTDSQIVRSMICKESHAFNTFVAVRLGEIHQSTNPNEWFWIDGDDNIADWVTRGKTPS